jgi:dTDP-4-amino-4,6-dideoxygalactose transaminase
MWIRLRLDIGWLDLISASASCLTPHDRATIVGQAARAWSEREDFLLTLSVRSAFDLTLRALQLPHGSEVLMSALTVPDMVRIVGLHGLIPVPVDTDEAGQIDIASLRRSITSKSRMVVVAHLFGGWTALDDVLQLARQHELMVVEDCAQSFHRVGDPAHPSSDVAMFSFGPIKTASALGGAVVRIQSTELRARMAEILQRDPLQSRASFLLRIARFAAIKWLTGKRAAALTRYVVERLGVDFDSLANRLVRGFAANDSLDAYRRQPSVPLLKLLARRWRSYDFGRLEKRMELGRLLDGHTGVRHSASHTYWVYPIFVHDPVGVQERFRRAGFDATCQARMAVVPGIDETRTAAGTSDLWKHVVFLPWYPELPQNAVVQMSRLIGSADLKTY